MTKLIHNDVYANLKKVIQNIQFACFIFFFYKRELILQLKLSFTSIGCLLPATYYLTFFNFLRLSLQNNYQKLNEFILSIHATERKPLRCCTWTVNPVCEIIYCCYAVASEDHYAGSICLEILSQLTIIPYHTRHTLTYVSRATSVV